jgi:hypothetical protein
MNQLRPILRGNPTREQRLVLSSAQLDEPPSHGKSRTLAALGLGGTLLATTQVASAVTATSVSCTGAVTAAGPMIGFGIAALKGIAIGLVAGSVVYGSIVAVRESEQPSPHPTEQQNQQTLVPSRGKLPQQGVLQPESADGPIATKRVGVAPLPVETNVASPIAAVAAESTNRNTAAAETIELPKDRPPPARSPRAVPVSNSAKDLPKSLPNTAVRSSSVAAIGRVASSSSTTAANKHNPPVAAHSLESEVALLDFAQRALAAGQPSVALQDLDTHRRLFPNPHLLPEATLVRIEALFALGRFAEARKLGEQLLAAQPAGALAQRVRSLLNLPAIPENP